MSEELPTRAESLALTRAEVKARTDRWEFVREERAERHIDCVFRLPTRHGMTIVIRLALPLAPGAVVGEEARRELAETVYALGYPTNGE